VELVSLPDNVGPAGRNVGMLRSHHDYVAFSDDDSWWEAGALDRATRLLDDHPDLAVVMGRLVVEPYGRVDDVCTEMSRSPLPADAALPGPAILGFLACGAVIRRQAFLEAGGFHPAYAVGGEEELLALDLASAGWKLAYCDDVVAHHQPAPGRDPARRRRIEVRNALWSTWLRLPADLIVSRSLRLMAQACRQPPVRAAVWDAIRGLPWVISERRPLPDRVVSAVRSLQW
jgi:GT2 family glycosyltransferase